MSFTFAGLDFGLMQGLHVVLPDALRQGSVP